MFLRFNAYSDEVCEITLDDVAIYNTEFDDGASGTDEGLVLILPVNKGEKLDKFFYHNDIHNFELNYNGVVEDSSQYNRFGIKPNKDESPDFYLLEFKQSEATGEFYLKSQSRSYNESLNVTVNNYDKVRKD